MSDIKVYALSTCVHCKHAKEYLEDHQIPYDCTHVDFLSGEERNQVMDIVRKLNPAVSFPTIVIGDKVIVGFRREEIEEALSKCEKK
ncbi:glutaredoxin [Solidesulfovibrio carbinoliphilus subsp. oakridgensis]|uniref:Glutaredoxin n=1 Tax=Solidesulfovibrio carbinoliphilus subsp. oakridgensis TaxID=694327 RepID=G7QA06_9BACT|nr:glutaredoxin family protein [Solidesulfovibrio carbinoliphilus]EHJ47836.1 glutaredoxin [Solidesulfovibrio carbinoliphilus subsp. oakridgensis]